MSRFRDREAKRRQGGEQAYREDDDVFLDRFNDHLSALEEELRQDLEETTPTIWVLGLPRSGTTLLTQLLAFCLDVGTVNNLIARFWHAPLTGARLSRIVLGDFKNADYHSRYGRSFNVSHPHEFSYFWQHWLCMEDMPPYVPADAEKKIDWTGLRNTLLGISAALGKPMVYKALDVGYHIGRFDALLRQSVFVYIERSFLDVAISMANARLDHYGELEPWWSMYPIDYEELVKLPYWEQIGGQIHSLSTLYKDQLDELPAGNMVHVRYRELCMNPGGVLDRICDCARSTHGFEFRRTQAAPDSFQVSKPQIDSKIKAKLIEGLATFGITSDSG